MNRISRRSFLRTAIAVLAIEHGRVSRAASRDPTFLVLGDWGQSSIGQRAVAAQMAKTAEAIHAQFVISTGDNFYPDGVKSVNDAQWVTTFEDVYDAPALMIPWYIVLGDHDYNGSANAQVDYTKLSPRWRLPATYYKHTKLLSDGSEADFFHLDTIQIKDDQYFGRQLTWLERELASSIAVWKIVVGHYPLYSGGTHGAKLDGTDELTISLEPLLQRFGVHVYINGHDHDMEHVVVGKTHYLTCGAASAPRPASAVKGTRFVMGDRLGFMNARLRPDEMDIEFIDEKGTSLYRTSIPRGFA